jgi:class 3 adenylate cyclase
MYQEAKLLEKTSKEIQKNANLVDILDTALEAICTRFSFDRTFVMLKNDKGDLLTTTAVAGIEEGADLIWKFKVNIGEKRDNPMVLSSVYHSGTSILIKDISQHLFQLTTDSQKLIAGLGASGFIMVAIPARDGNWGVLIADRVKDGPLLDRRDVVLLERLAQQMGIALDKQADLESEKRQRHTFQKYVPADILALTKGIEAPVLGGTEKNIACMFIDIRDFTALAQAYPPTAVLEILNRVFAMIQPIVSGYNGVIDKFLGDGALITWGAVGTQPWKYDDTVLAAKAIIDRIPALNESLNKLGYPTVRIGIGINAGPAIVGNVGSDSRMEYTAIGSTVNVASRLEGLCKKLEAVLLISDSVYIQLSSSLQNIEWVRNEDTQLRGVSERQRIWFLREELAELKNIHIRRAA